MWILKIYTNFFFFQTMNGDASVDEIHEEVYDTVIQTIKKCVDLPILKLWTDGSIPKIINKWPSLAFFFFKPQNYEIKGHCVMFLMYWFTWPYGWWFQLIVMPCVILWQLKSRISTQLVLSDLGQICRWASDFLSTFLTLQQLPMYQFFLSWTLCSCPVICLTFFVEV